MFLLILKSALGMKDAVSGIIDVAVSTSVERGIYANEAGQGTAPHVASSMQHPKNKGFA